MKSSLIAGIARWGGVILAGVTLVSLGHLLLLIGVGWLGNQYYTPNAARLVMASALTWIAWSLWADKTKSDF